MTARSASLGRVCDAARRQLVQLVSNRTYSYTTHRVDDDVLFWNWSYEEDPPMGLRLDAADEADRYPIQLYHATATQAADLAGKQVLEVGCGRGGGASYLTRTLKPANFVGLDLIAASIEFCRRRHRVRGLEFVVGDAHNLPFPDASFDAVINIESSQCYSNFERFLHEVARVLRPGGVLLYADTRRRRGCAHWDAALRTVPGLSVVSWRESNAEVLRGMEANSARWQTVADELAPRPLRPLLRRSVPGRGTPFWRIVHTGQVSYRLYCLAKAGPSQDAPASGADSRQPLA